MGFLILHNFFFQLGYTKKEAQQFFANECFFIVIVVLLY